MFEVFSPPRRRVVAAMVAGLVAAGVTVAGCSSPDDQGESGVDVSVPPTNVTWQQVGPAQAPKADQGPVKTGSSGEAVGFEHSPQGVGLAAMNTPLRVALAGDQSWPVVIRESVVPNRARDELVNDRAAYQVTEFDRDLAPQLAGYRITDYTDAAAGVEVFAEYSDQSKSSSFYQMVWSSGDWKLDLSADKAGTVSSIDQFPDEMVKVAKA